MEKENENFRKRHYFYTLMHQFIRTGIQHFTPITHLLYGGTPMQAFLAPTKRIYAVYTIIQSMVMNMKYENNILGVYESTELVPVLI